MVVVENKQMHNFDQESISQNTAQFYYLIIIYIMY